MRRAAWLTLLFGVASSGEGQTRQVIAVMAPIHVTQHAVSADEAKLLLDKIYYLLSSTLDAQRFTLMTPENMERLLPEGLSLMALDGASAAEIAKKINARYIINAEIGRLGTRLKMKLELYDGPSAALLNLQQGEGDDASELDGALESAVPSLLKEGSLASQGELAIHGRRVSAESIDLQLKTAVKSMFNDAKPPKGHKLKVAVQKIEDDGISGGERADWLRERMIKTLSQTPPIEVRELPEPYLRKDIPRELNAVVAGNVFSRRDGEQPLMEAIWHARVPAEGGTAVKTASVVIPSDAAPQAPQLRVPDVPEDSGLTIRLSASGSGSLCPGEVSQVYVQTTKARYIQVFDLYGKDKALLLFPNSDTGGDGRLEPGKPLSIAGTCGFQAMPAEGTGAERFLVIGAETKEELGSTAQLKGYCRVKPADAAKLWKPAELPESLAKAVDGFRIHGGAECAQRVKKSKAALPASAQCQLTDDVSEAAAEAATAGLPWCE